MNVKKFELAWLTIKYLRYVQLRTHQWIQSTSNICTGRIFDMLLRTLNEIFLETSLQRFVALIFTLLQCLKTSKKSMFHIACEAYGTHKSHFHECSRTHWGSIYRSISTKKVPKEELFNRLQIFERYVSKIFGLALTAGRQNFVQYILMKYFGFIDVFSTVVKNNALLDFWIYCGFKITSTYIFWDIFCVPL